MLVECNVFLSIPFPVFPSFQFSKLTFFRDSSFSFQFNKTMSNKYQYILSQYLNLHIIWNYSVAESVIGFLVTIVSSYGDIFKPWLYINCLRYPIFLNIDIFDYLLFDLLFSFAILLLKNTSNSINW